MTFHQAQCWCRIEGTLLMLQSTAGGCCNVLHSKGDELHISQVLEEPCVLHREKGKAIK